MRTAIIGFCAIAFIAAGLRAATETEGDRLASMVTPFLEDQTLLVVHLDLMALDAAKTVDWLAELLQLSDAAHQKARADVAPINVVTQALPKDATIDIMIVSSLADLSRMPFMVVLPLDGTVPSRAIAGELSRDLEKQWQRKIVNEEIGKALDRDGIAVRSGHHCAQPILRRMGVESTVRPSLAFYNTCEEIDALVAALLRIQAGRGHRGL